MENLPIFKDINKEKMFIINQYNYGDNRFIITIDTTKGTGSTFTLPTRSGYSYNCTVDWGDGSTSEITAYNDADITHTYASGGVYQIKISGTFQAWYFNNGGDKLKLISIDNWGNVGFTSLAYAFYGCTNLLKINATDSINGNITDLTRFFSSCSNLENLNQKMLWNLTNLVNLYTFCYQCYKLKSIPVDFYKYNTKINEFSFTHFDNRALTALPEDLLYNNKLIKSYASSFYNCRNIILPSRLFDLSALSIATTFENFMRVASTSYSFTGTIQDIWNYATGATSTNAFLNQTAISNYSSIPNGWKGL